MNKAILLITIILTAISCTSCSFIQEKFFNRSSQEQYDNQDQTTTEEQQEKRKTGPIPVNPNHS